MWLKDCFKFIKTQYNDKCVKEDVVFDEAPLFTKEILDDFRCNVGQVTRTETGGMIGCSDSDNMNHIDLWYFDKDSVNTPGSFAYNVNEVTKQYHNWKEKGGRAVGFVHSHPIGYRKPSFDDIKLSLTLMDFFKNDFFYMPIVQSNKKGRFELLFYIVRKKEDCLTLDLAYEITACDNDYKYYKGDMTTKYFDIALLRDKAHVSNTADNNCIDKTNKPNDDYFSRLKDFYPNEVLNKVLVYIGCGGVRSEIINMARNGFKNFVLIDGDIVSPTNIATQGVYRNEMGMNKVDAIAREIEAINPNTNIVKVPKMLDSSMSDKEFMSFLKSFPNAHPTDFLILGMTDSHHAQARAAMLALNYGIPYIGAAMYQYGLGGEVIFTYPGVTPSCPRCMLRSRYEAYENGFINDVTSAGCPTFATERLNTTIGFISIMMLMYNCSPGSPYNKMLDAVAEKNFVQIRMSPFLSDKLNVQTFNMAFNEENPFLYFDETIWVPQHPDSPKYGEKTCKLCQGTGDLITLVGKLNDTRLAAPAEEET